MTIAIWQPRRMDRRRSSLGGIARLYDLAILWRL